MWSALRLSAIVPSARNATHARTTSTPNLTKPALGTPQLGTARSRERLARVYLSALPTPVPRPASLCGGRPPAVRNRILWIEAPFSATLVGGMEMAASAALIAPDRG